MFGFTLYNHFYVQIRAISLKTFPYLSDAYTKILFQKILLEYPADKVSNI